jgi:hypothetical protein
MGAALVWEEIESLLIRWGTDLKFKSSLGTERFVAQVAAVAGVFEPLDGQRGIAIMEAVYPHRSDFEARRASCALATGCLSRGRRPSRTAGL